MESRGRAGASGCYLCSWAAGAEHGVEVFDEDLGEDVDGHQGAQRDGAVSRPDQVHPEHAGQVRRTHLVHDALLRHLKTTQRLISSRINNCISD